WRWAGVPFYIRTGKCLPLTTTEVRVRLKRPPLTDLASGSPNTIRLTLSPGLNIALEIDVKKAGGAMKGRSTELQLHSSPAGAEMTAYERLLGDALAGDKILFAREDAIEAAWAIVDPILDNQKPVLPYEPGSWGPAESEQLLGQPPAATLFPGAV
ncbi:MAG: glucose-6-phosphate dehydrogenase, partial [bacterium]